MSREDCWSGHVICDLCHVIYCQSPKAARLYTLEKLGEWPLRTFSLRHWSCDLSSYSVWIGVF